MADDLPVCPVCGATFPCTNLAGKIPVHPGREDADGIRARTCPGSLRDEDRNPYPVPPSAKIRIESTYKKDAVKQLKHAPKVIQLKGEFNHCPFCGSDNLWVRIDRKGRSYVECAGCCAHGPILTDILDAANDERAIGQIIDRWNTRKMRGKA